MKSVMKQMQHNDDLASYMLLAGVGETIPIKESIQKNLEKFTIQIVYNHKLIKNLPEARTRKWEAMKRKSTQRLPPDTDSHKHHAARVNYVAYMYTHYDEREGPPSPIDNGWTLDNGESNIINVA